MNEYLFPVLYIVYDFLMRILLRVVQQRVQTDTTGENPKSSKTKQNMAKAATNDGLRSQPEKREAKHDRAGWMPWLL
jgi:hypothetical protein